ncbi:MAG: hypothetical protein ACTSRG_24735 [Candidatus Helarchaeota archaeon]
MIIINKTAFNHLPDDDVFYDILSNKGDGKGNYLWIESLSWSLGRQKNISDIKSYIYDNIVKSENELAFYANVGPAVGLLSTFVGMILVLLNIKSDASSLTSNIRVLSNLYPVYIGSVLGLFLYVGGNYIKKGFYKTADEKSENYLHIFLDIERTIIPADPKEIADAYARLLKPISDLILKLNEVNDGFDSFLIMQDDYNKSQKKNTQLFQDATNSFMEKYDQKSNVVFENIQGLINSVEKINNSFGSAKLSIDDYSSKLNTYTDNIQKFIGNTKSLDKILSDFYKVMPQLNDTFKSLSDATDRIKFQINGVNALKEEIQKYTLQIIDFSKGISVINSSFTDFVEKIPPKQIIEINNNIEKVSSLLESFYEIYNKNEKKPDEVSPALHKIILKMSDLNKSLETRRIINTQIRKVDSNIEKDNVSEAILDVLVNINDTLNKKNKISIFGTGLKKGLIKTINSIFNYFNLALNKIKNIFSRNEKKK